MDEIKHCEVCDNVINHTFPSWQNLCEVCIAEVVADWERHGFHTEPEYMKAYQEVY